MKKNLVQICPVGQKLLEAKVVLPSNAVPQALLSGVEWTAMFAVLYLRGRLSDRRAVKADPFRN
jgi:hypothetical protein